MDGKTHERSTLTIHESDKAGGRRHAVPCTLQASTSAGAALPLSSSQARYLSDEAFFLSPLPYE